MAMTTTPTMDGRRMMLTTHKDGSMTKVISSTVNLNTTMVEKGASTKIIKSTTNLDATMVTTDGIINKTRTTIGKVIRRSDGSVNLDGGKCI